MKIVVFALLLSVHCELTIALKRKHFYIKETKTWRDAQTYCRENYEDLSSVDSLEEFTAISATVSEYSWSWIGLKMISANRWRWSDGSNKDFYNWAFGQPNDPEHAYCGLLIDGRLYDNYCSTPYTFFCYKWEPELIVVRENKSWEDALQHCRTHYRDLASLPSYLHLIQVNQTIANPETASVWTGLRFLSGSWFWVSGEDPGDLVQLPTCPANHSVDCGSLNLKTHSWENRDCSEKLHFVCY